MAAFFPALPRALFVRDKAGEDASCLQECTFDGQRTSGGLPRDARSDRMIGRSGPSDPQGDLPA